VKVLHKNSCKFIEKINTCQYCWSSKLKFLFRSYAQQELFQTDLGIVWKTKPLTNFS